MKNIWAIMDNESTVVSPEFETMAEAIEWAKAHTEGDGFTVDRLLVDDEGSWVECLEEYVI